MELFDAYHQQVKDAYQAKKISQTCYESLIKRTADDLETHFSELIYSLEHADYYKLLERIENGYNKIVEETDPKKKSEYRRLLNELTIKLDGLLPKEESA